MGTFGCTDTVGGVSGALQGQLGGSLISGRSQGSLVSGPAGGQWAVGSGSKSSVLDDKGHPLSQGLTS